MFRAWDCALTESIQAEFLHSFIHKGSVVGKRVVRTILDCQLVQFELDDHLQSAKLERRQRIVKSLADLVPR